MTEENFTLDLLYAAIEQHIADAVSGLNYVGTMPDLRERIDVPAVVIELAGLESGLDQGTGETALVARLEARVIVGSERDQCQQQAAFAAAQIAVLLRTQTWGLEVGQAEFVRCAQDWTRPELDGYAVWVVEWNQPIWLGKQEWPWPIQPPGTLVFRVGPDAESVEPEELQ